MSTSGGNVLVVEDKENMLEMVGQILDAHHDVVTAVDGTRALALLESRAFDVVLTDVRMPGADGFEVVRRTKEKMAFDRDRQDDGIRVLSRGGVGNPPRGLRLHPEALRSRRAQLGGGSSA